MAFNIKQGSLGWIDEWSDNNDVS